MLGAKICLAWLYAITKYGYPTPIDSAYRVFDDATRLGFAYIEIEAVGAENLREIEDRKEELKAKLEELGLKVANFAGIFRELVSPSGTERRKAVELMRRSADLAVYFGAEMLQTDTFTPPIEFIGPQPYLTTVAFADQYKVRINSSFSWRAFWSTLVDSMKLVTRVAADRGLKMVVEPRVGETISNSDAMLRLIDEVSEDNFGSVLDIGHLHAAKELIPLSIEKLGRKIFYVHASDNDGRDNYHWAVGRGTVDWEGAFEALRKHGFTGPIAV
ncbi:MAG: sugar phosphate isomerase/epimerase family protein, partial [Thermofilaceae archaeon]